MKKITLFFAILCVSLSARAIEINGIHYTFTSKTSPYTVEVGIALIFIYKQAIAVSKAMKELRKANEDMLQLIHKSDEANIIKE